MGLHRGMKRAKRCPEKVARAPLEITLNATQRGQRKHDKKCQSNKSESKLSLKRRNYNIQSNTIIEILLVFLNRDRFKYEALGEMLK